MKLDYSIIYSKLTEDTTKNIEKVDSSCKTANRSFQELNNINLKSNYELDRMKENIKKDSKVGIYFDKNLKKLNLEEKEIEPEFESLFSRIKSQDQDFKRVVSEQNNYSERIEENIGSVVSQIDNADNIYGQSREITRRYENLFNQINSMRQGMERIIRS